jgi:hypothetical protein
MIGGGPSRTDGNTGVTTFSKRNATVSVKNAMIVSGVGVGGRPRCVDPGEQRPPSASGPGWPPPKPSPTRFARRGGRQPSGLRSWIRPWGRAQRLMDSPERAGRRASEG